MIRARLFLGLIAVGIAGVLLLQRPVPPGDFYTNIPEGRSLFLDALIPTELAATKLQHGRLNAPYDIGVFGTSRNVNVNAKDLNIPDQSFFNFAVPGGASMRWSLHILEQLSRAGHAPRTAVIMFDHAEQQAYGNPWLSPLTIRWTHGVLDLQAGLKSDHVPPKGMLRMIWRYGFQEFRIFKQSFSWELLKRGILYYLGLDDGYARLVEAGEVGYGRDGSRSLPADADANLGVIERGPPAVMMGYLSVDLERLAHIKAQGTRVIVYESPLHPTSAAFYEKDTSAIASRTRTHFISECQRLKLECHLAPAAKDFIGTQAWRDATHPPAALLSAYIRGLIVQ